MRLLSEQVEISRRKDRLGRLGERKDAPVRKAEVKLAEAAEDALQAFGQMLFEKASVASLGRDFVIATEKGVVGKMGLPSRHELRLMWWMNGGRLTALRSQSMARGESVAQAAPLNPRRSPPW